MVIEDMSCAAWGNRFIREYNYVESVVRYKSGKNKGGIKDTEQKSEF